MNPDRWPLCGRRGCREPVDPDDSHHFLLAFYHPNHCPVCSRHAGDVPPSQGAVCVRSHPAEE